MDEIIRRNDRVQHLVFANIICMDFIVKVYVFIEDRKGYINKRNQPRTNDQWAHNEPYPLRRPYNKLREIKAPKKNNNKENHYHAIINTNRRRVRRPPTDIRIAK